MSNEDDLKGLFEPTDGQPNDFMSNFGMVIPTERFTMGDKQTKKKFWIRVRVLYPNWLDWLLKPLCRIGWHRWVATYRFLSYEPFVYGMDDPSTAVKIRSEQHYQCARCKEKKSGKIL